MTDAMTETDASPRRMRGWVAEYLPLMAMLLLLMAARDSLANHYHVPSGSMEPTLMPGDRIAVDMRAYGVRMPFTDIELHEGPSPQPGDVVVFDSPTDGTRLIKRLVAVSGQTVALTDGRLTVEGVPLRIDGERALGVEASSAHGVEPLRIQRDALEARERFGDRIVRLNLDDGGGPDIPPTRIPDGMGLVLGDHRGNSADGRYFGLVPLDAFYGKAVAIYHRSGEGFGWTRL